MPISIPEMKTLRFQGPRSIAASSDASILFGAGYTHHRTHLVLGGGLLLAHITAVNVYLNGRLFRQLGSATNLDRRNKYYGMTAFSANNVLTISHIREGLRRFVESHSTAIGMATGVANPVDSMEIRLTLSASAPAPSTIDVYGEVSAPKETVFVLQDKEDLFEYTTNGDKLMNQIFQRDEVLDCLFFELTGCAVDEIQLTYADKLIQQRIAALQSHIQASTVYRTAQADLWTFDKSERGFGKEPIVYGPSGRFEAKLTLSGISGSASVKLRKSTIENWVA
jgi:hypothetical protein